MKEILKTLLGAYGATGRESGVCEVIRKMVAPYVDEMSVDALGNLICVKKGAGKRIMFAAHMDQIGFVVREIDENGFLRVHNVGGINRGVSLMRHVVFANGVNGVVAHEYEDFKPAENSMTPLFIDIGAKDRADAEKMVEIGDVAVYAPDVFELGNDLIAGPAMDNRVGCAIVVGMLKRLKNCPNEVIAVFTTQEEVGVRGAQAAAFSVDPDIGIALDVTLSGDTPKGIKITTCVGGGACVKIMDTSLICHPRVVAMMEAAAQKAGIVWQREVLTTGGTDASAIQVTKGGIPAGVLSIACRYVHSACETVSLADIEGGVRLLTALAQTKDLA